MSAFSLVSSSLLMFNNMFCCCCLLCKSSFYPGSSPTSSEQPPLSFPWWSSGSDCSCNAQHVGLIPGRGTKIPHVCGMAKFKKKKSTNKKEKSKPNKKGNHKPNKKEKKKKKDRTVPLSYLRGYFPGLSPQQVCWIKRSSQFLGCVFFFSRHHVVIKHPGLHPPPTTSSSL